MGMAFASTLAPGESFTTIELRINFFRPVWEAHLRVESKAVRRGSVIGYVECEITDEGSRLIAKASSTCLALRGECARGRWIPARRLFRRNSHFCLQVAIQMSLNGAQRLFGSLKSAEHVGAFERGDDESRQLL